MQQIIDSLKTSLAALEAEATKAAADIAAAQTTIATMRADKAKHDAEDAAYIAEVAAVEPRITAAIAVLRTRP
jgi:chromosome segregation ATPase